jgi:hypothetical protein
MAPQEEAWGVLHLGQCIDQQSTKEKEQQVPLMGDIYTGASEVYIWLGANSAATERAMVYLA